MQDLEIIFGQQIYLKLPYENQVVKYLLCVLDVFTKYAWVKTVLNGFIEIVNKSKVK